MKIALAQLNPIVGDIAGNVEKVADAVARARAAGADLVVAPELVVCGYPPKDLLLREGFVARCDEAVTQLATRLAGQPPLLLGHPTRRDQPDGAIGNAASLLADGHVVATVQKTLLPNYDVFDEKRYFHPGPAIEPIEFKGRRLGVHICEDAWWGEISTSYHFQPDPQPDPVARLAAAGADLLINVSASPFEVTKPGRRESIIRRHATRHKLPFVFVNQVGGDDDLVFDGRSFVLDSSGQCVTQLKRFETDFALYALGTAGSGCPDAQNPDRLADILDALVLGLRDYATKCGFKQCVLGLSGGIDSALACYVAARALGAENVHGLMMPSRHSSTHSVDDARQLAETLGVDHEVIPIDAIHKAYEQTAVVGTDLAREPGGLPDQNLQARIRGAIVMLRSNTYGWIPLATGNKSELAVGYCTIYGDMAGGFAVLSDLLKRDVYAVSRYINEVREGREVIPNSTLTKPPSAELAPGQVDQDSLPPYEILDAVLEALIERDASVESLTKKFDPEIVRWIARKLDLNEFKRRQMPPGIKLSTRAFGSGRRMPIAARFGH